MKLKNRQKEGDTKGFEEGSEYWLKIKIWKLEQDWNEQQANEANTKSKVGAANNSNNLEDELLKTMNLPAPSTMHYTELCLLKFFFNLM